MLIIFNAQNVVPNKITDSTIQDKVIVDVEAMDLLARGLDKRIKLGEQEPQPYLPYWEHLAQHFKVPKEDAMMCKHPPERSPSKNMFECLNSGDPGFSITKLEEKLEIIERNDLVEKLKSLPSGEFLNT